MVVPTKHWQKYLSRAASFAATNPTGIESLHFIQRGMAVERRITSEDIVIKHAKLLEGRYTVDIGDLPFSDEFSRDTFTYKRKLISSIFLEKLWSYLMITSHIKPKSVLDIGGSYGMLASFFDCDYTIIDFPVMHSYGRAFERLKGFKTTRMNIGEEITQDYDLIINENSLQEMNVQARDYWLGIVAERCNYFYSLNYNKGNKSFSETVGIDPLGSLDENKWVLLHDEVNLAMWTDPRDWRMALMARSK